MLIHFQPCSITPVHICCGAFKESQAAYLKALTCEVFTARVQVVIFFLVTKREHFLLFFLKDASRVCFGFQTGTVVNVLSFSGVIPDEKVVQSETGHLEMRLREVGGYQHLKYLYKGMEEELWLVEGHLKKNQWKSSFQIQVYVCVSLKS